MKCDFHVHTEFSFDSLAKIEEVLKKAKEKNLDCIAIVDHNEIEGALKAIKISKKFGILVIPGIEVKSKEGDIIALNVKKKIQPKMPAKETIKEIKKLGGFVILPHPFAFPFENFKGKIEEILKEIDAIEVLNASVFFGNKKALNFAKKYNLPFVAGSDSHFSNFLGKVFFEIEGENLKIEEILERIKNKKVKIFGKEANFFEKLIDHLKRNFVKLIKILKNAQPKKRKIQKN